MPDKEIRRSLRVVRFLESLDAAALVRAAPPRQTPDLISVVVPMYNASGWIVPCLKSLLAQTHTNFEIFCVDDASEDDTYERVLSEFGSDRRLCAVRLRRNVGPYQIKNWVIATLARGRLIALQDADDISHPTRLDEQRRWMERHQLAVCGTCVHQFFPPAILPLRGHTTPIALHGMMHNLAFYSTMPRTQAPRTIPDLLRGREGFRFQDSRGRTVYVPNHASAAYYGSYMIDRSVFLAFGGFDGHTRIEADKEFSWRLLRFYDIGNVPKVLYSRRFHALSLTQHPSTGLSSPLRRRYCRKRDRHHETVRQALEASKLDTARDLCVADLFYGDVEVAEVHSGFDLPSFD